VTMHMQPPTAGLDWDEDRGLILCSGDWTSTGLAAFNRRTLQALPPKRSQGWTLDASGMTRLDLTGARQLHRLQERLEARGEMVLLGAERPDQMDGLLAFTRQAVSERQPQPRAPGLLERIGRDTVGRLQQSGAFLSFIGEITLEALPRLLRPWTIRWKQLAAEIQKAGVQALPIIGLLAFLVGLVIAYQGGETLERYGANIFLVELISVTMLREMAPLLTAIVVAGRTGSSWAAQLGTMKITEEIDALRTLGISPYDMLILPRLMALIVVLPLLTIYADVLGIVGGMLVADLMFGLPTHEFINRLPEAIAASHLWVGIIKAPVFALIIVGIACFQGMRVQGSAESVGRATTVTVVQAIFLVIVADAVFSILFNLVGL